MPNGPARILIVDDSETFTEMVAMILHPAGWQTKAVPDAESAMNALTQASYDLVVLDQQLQGRKTGTEFLEEAKGLLGKTPVIFASSHLDLATATHLTQKGVEAIFTKPIEPGKFRDKVKELIEPAPEATPVQSSLSLRPKATTPAPGTVSPVRADGERGFLFQFARSGRAFSTRLMGAGTFSYSLLLYGKAGSPFRAVARDLLRVSPRTGEVFREISPDEMRKADTLIKTLGRHRMTLFLDRIEVLSPEEQKQVYAFLKLFCGAKNGDRCRIIFSTYLDQNGLEQQVENGLFSEELFQFIDAMTLVVPTFLEFADDLTTLARNILKDYRLESGGESPVDLDDEAADWLIQQPWLEGFEEFERVLHLSAGCSSGRLLEGRVLRDCQRKMAALRAMAPDLAGEEMTVQVAPPVETHDAQAQGATDFTSPGDPPSADLPEAIAAVAPLPVPTKQTVASRKNRQSIGSYDFTQRLSKLLPNPPSEESSS